MYLINMHVYVVISTNTLIFVSRAHVTCTKHDVSLTQYIFNPVLLCLLYIAVVLIIIHCTYAVVLLLYLSITMCSFLKAK